MSDYKATQVMSTSWQRCNNVAIGNPYDGSPTVMLSEETITVLGDATIKQSADGINFNFDPNIVIQMRNPETGEAIPGATMTGAQVYVALYSLYIQKAIERDDALAQSE